MEYIGRNLKCGHSCSGVRVYVDPDDERVYAVYECAQGCSTEPKFIANLPKPEECEIDY